MSSRLTQVPPPPAGVGPLPQTAGLLIRVKDRSAATLDTIRRQVIQSRADLPLPGSVMRLVLVDSTRLAAAGIACGLVAAGLSTDAAALFRVE